MEFFYITGHSLGPNSGLHWAQGLGAKKNGVLRLQDGVTAAVLGRLQRFDSGRSVMGQTGTPPIRVFPRQEVGSARGASVMPTPFRFLLCRSARERARCLLWSDSIFQPLPFPDKGKVLQVG